MINSFSGSYRFLSNFWPSQVELDGRMYPTVEHAYQAAKIEDREAREQFRLASRPGDAKRLGRKVKLRSNWEGIKYDVMLQLVRQKFFDAELAQLLINTGEEELVEGNTWGDTYWGVCNGKGQNNLGKILMQVRDEIRYGTHL